MRLTATNPIPLTISVGSLAFAPPSERDFYVQNFSFGYASRRYEIDRGRRTRSNFSTPASPKALANLPSLGARLQQQWRIYASNRPIYENTQGWADDLLFDAPISTPRELDINKDEYWDVVRQTHRATCFDRAEKVNNQDATYRTMQASEKSKPKTLADLALLAKVVATTSMAKQGGGPRLGQNYFPRSRR